MFRFVVWKFTIVITIALIVFGFSGSARANHLDAKWTEQRQEANNLGDSVKDGDVISLGKLRNLAKDGTHGPAMHNMGWLLENGHQLDKDRTAACVWYEKAAILHDYPPSMHNYALCLFEQSKDWKSDANAVRGRELMQGAAQLGWTNSAIILTEKILNYALLSREDAHWAKRISVDALENTRPSNDEFSVLHYFVGMAAIFGPEDIEYYRDGHASLSIAMSSGHALAPAALAQIETLWVNEVVRRQKQVDNYEVSTEKSYIENCYDNLDDENIEDHLLDFCKKNVERIFSNIIRLSEDANELSSMVMGESGDKIRAAQRELSALERPYRRAKINWELKFVPQYNDRMQRVTDQP